MKHIITLILSLCSIMASAQTVTNPPSGSKPYGTPVATPSGEIMVGRTGSYTYITRKAYTDSLIALGYTKAQVDSAISANLENETLQTVTGRGNTTPDRIIIYDGTVDIGALDTTTSPSITSTKPKFLIARTTDTTSDVSEHGFSDITRFRSTLTDRAYNSFDSFVDIGTGLSNDYNHFLAFQSRPKWASSGELTLLQGFRDSPVISNGNVRYRYGVRISPGAVSGSGNIERNFGIWIEPLTAGSIETYAILTSGSTPSKFGGSVTAGSFIVNGGSSSDFLIADGTMRPALSTYLNPFNPPAYTGDFNNIPEGAFVATISGAVTNLPDPQAKGAIISFGSSGVTGGRIISGRTASDEMWYSSGAVTNPYYRVASREWVNGSFVDLSTNQSNIGGDKKFTGSVSISTSATPASLANQIAFGGGGSGQYIQGYKQSSSALSFLLRGYASGGTQMTLYDGGIEVASGWAPTANNHVATKGYVDDGFVDKSTNQTIGGDKTFTGEIEAASFSTTGGTLIDANVSTDDVTATGEIQAGSISTTGNASITGTVSAANINELPTRSLNTSLGDVIAGQTLTYTTTYTGVSSGDVIAVGVSGSIGATDLIITASSTSTAGQVIVKFYNPTGSDIPIGNISIKLKAFK